METFVVRIILIGLIAFVPTEDNGKMTALILNAWEPQTLSNGCRTPRHLPTVSFFAEKCEGDCLRVDMRGLTAPNEVLNVLSGRLTSSGNDPETRISGAWLLLGEQSREDLEFRLPSAQGSEEVNIIRGRRQRRAGRLLRFPVMKEPACEAEDYSWLAHGSRIMPLAGRVDRDCLENALHCPILARLNATRGTVKVCSLNQRFDGDGNLDNDRVFSYEFRSLISRFNPRFTQAIVDAISIEFEVAAEYLEFVASDFETGDEKAIARLWPNEAGFLDIVIGNVPFPVNGKLPGATCPDRIGVDQHFELFYDLAAGPIPKNRRPVPHALAESRAARDVQPRACPGVAGPLRPQCEMRVEEFYRLLWGVDVPLNRPECDSYSFDPIQP